MIHIVRDGAFLYFFSGDVRRILIPCGTSARGTPKFDSEQSMDLVVVDFLPGASRAFRTMGEWMGSSSSGTSKSLARTISAGQMDCPGEMGINWHR